MKRDASDKRSQRIIVVCHCILNVHSLEDDLAIYPGLEEEVIELLIQKGVGLYQIPCPEIELSGIFRKALPKAPDFIMPLLGVVGILVVLCGIELLMWKKWAFWLICLMSTIVMVLQLSVGFGAKSFVGPLGVLILYGLLQLGKESTWKQLQ